jgi:hypothetical protein
MKTWVWLAILTVWIAPWVRAQDEERGRKLESGGDAAGTRAALAEAARNRPQDAAALGEYAEFLDRYGDPGAREAYEKLLAALVRAGDSARAAALAKRLVGYDLLAGDRGAAATHAQAYRAATGETLALPGQTSAPAAAAMAVIPGPLRSFARMTAISGDAAPEDIFPALARNVVTNGYEASHSNEGLEQTEYLKLVHRYLSQARELEKMAGEAKVVSVPACDAANVGDLLRILGFRMRGGCGSELVLETVNAARAFITADSGFPVNKLEDALRTNRPFSYDFHPTIAPVLFGPEYWTSGNKETQDFLEALLGDPAVCRLYLGFSKLDYETAEALRKGGSYSHWKAYSHVLDFFGGMFQIRNGKAVIPGGARAETAWQEMVGVSPEKGAAFFDRLVAKDDGWLASLYDALARIDTPLRDYLLEPARMKRFYSAIRGRITSPGPARPVFRSNTDMMLLTTQLELDGAGRPRIPGSLEVWKRLFTDSPQGKYDGKLTRLAASWKEPDDLVEALFALCRKSVENEPLKIFMAISAISTATGRCRFLRPPSTSWRAATTTTAASTPMFSESRRLSDKSIAQFFDTAVEAINNQRDTLDSAPMRRVVSRRCWHCGRSWCGMAPSRKTAPTKLFWRISAPFVQVRGNRELFDASRNGVKALLELCRRRHGRRGRAGANARSAGRSRRNRATSEVREEVDAGYGANPRGPAPGLARHPASSWPICMENSGGAGSKRRSGRDREAGPISDRSAAAARPAQPARSNAVGFGYWSDKHLDGERGSTSALAVERAGGDPEKLKELAGLLAPSCAIPW